MSTNLEYRARQRQRKRERRQASEAQRQKKQRRHFLLEEQRENVVAAVTTWEILAATNAMWKWLSGSGKKVKENMYDISSKKRVTKKFLEVSHSRSRKTAAKKCTEKVCCTCKVVFHRSPALPSPLSITRFYILFINKYYRELCF